MYRVTTKLSYDFFSCQNLLLIRGVKSTDFDEMYLFTVLIVFSLSVLGNLLCIQFISISSFGALDCQGPTQRLCIHDIDELNIHNQTSIMKITAREKISYFTHLSRVSTKGKSCKKNLAFKVYLRFVFLN